MKSEDYLRRLAEEQARIQKAVEAAQQRSKVKIDQEDSSKAAAAS